MTFVEINSKTTTFLSKYKLFETNLIQQVQLQHRLDLVEAFGVKKGMRVIEIGCGQGDTSVALADAVGDYGEVIGIDIASRDYGAPLTLGQATDIIKSSALGERITFHFEMDFGSFESSEIFDVAVLSHSSWYFKRPEDLLRYFKKLRRMTKCICFAEWNLDFTHISQRVHFCAASILAMYSNFVKNDGNIQNLFHKEQIRELLEKVGFKIVKQGVVDASYLQDAQWEKSYANSIRNEFANAPSMIRTLVTSYYELMNVSNEKEKSLNSFILNAK
ncbi:SAM-dependent methyltransferase [Oceanobacillus chungangensis]|uniref:Class I SAM-dependent methyltransferase n=1 Tax=Oceanobacillus chungangensis TaxID=1229152 RepID=A0A3D8PGE6_9BACI|nr:class I SAM-dependent methyltransferase [Oceanobacillus chungangensis]RDW15154.1 class I SAM-dependent methyltransferase [Oceanobacillus chungangensis]